MARGAPSEARIGYSIGPNELILSGTFQKKVITVNYDFPGYLYATAPGADPATNFLQKNQIFYRETTAPGLYAPLLLIALKAYSTAGSNHIDVANIDKNKLGSGLAALLSFWDNANSVFATGGNDVNRYVSSIGADDSATAGAGFAQLELSGAVAYTPTDTADAVCVGIDGGVRNIINYVIVDQEIDLRSTAKPQAISANFALNAVYGARINQRCLNGYDVFPSNFLAKLRSSQGRLIIDNPQV